MLKTLSFFALIGIGLLFYYCKPVETNSPEELSLYIKDPDNNVFRQVRSNGYQIGILYKPADLMVHENRSSLGDVVFIDSLRALHSGYYHFILRLSCDANDGHEHNHEWKNDHAQMLAFRLGNSVTIVTSLQDTIPVYDFRLDRESGSPHAIQLIFSFQNESAKVSEWVQVNLDDFGLDTGDQSFLFKTADLEQVPRLRFSAK